MIIFVWIAVAGALLAGCALVPQPPSAAQNQQPTATPFATPDPSGFQGVEPRACIVSDWNTMQTDKPSGSLIAWQPGSSSIPRLAYLAPGNRSSWYTGVLMLASGTGFEEHKELATNVLATGDLTWSPSGDRLAFLAFRPDENVYTVMTVNADGSGLTDLFPTDLARTDSRTSQKAIIGWRDDNTVQVMSSCGEECRQAFDITIDEPAGPVLTPTPVEYYKDLTKNLTVDPVSPKFDKEDFPRGMSDETAVLNEAPNGDLIAYLDRRAILWMVSVPEQIMYVLDIGLRDVEETQWSLDSTRLAVRAEDRIFVFEIPCRSQTAP